MPKAAKDASNEKEVYDVITAVKVFMSLKLKFTDYETFRTK